MCILVRKKVDLYMLDIKGMTHGNQFRGFFGGHDAGNSGGFKNIAFFYGLILYPFKR